MNTHSTESVREHGFERIMLEVNFMRGSPKQNTYNLTTEINVVSFIQEGDEEEGEWGGERERDRIKPLVKCY